ncbi:MAG: hypothetical protein LBS56_02710 [Propionibacteriaceae bacterium]|jgi:hypothetical protein|nr:hypothetical protein [Propionibacteriaceae bacterium]
MSGENIGLEAQYELSELIAGELCGAIPEGADEIRHVTSMFVQYSQSMTLLFRDGEEVDSLSSVGSVKENVRSLRKAMYSPEGGTWFSAVFRVFRDGRMKASFNYDEEPVVTDVRGQPREIMPALYAKDLEVFPRSAKATPAWLAAKVEDGRAQIARIEAEERVKHAE